MAETLATETAVTGAVVTESVSPELSASGDTDSPVEGDGADRVVRSVRSAPPSEEFLVQEGDAAGDYLE
ncbi:MAG: hypothetical protein ACRDRT_14580, partial [Pseudonocardiaceae bacterium]